LDGAVMWEGSVTAKKRNAIDETAGVDLGSAYDEEAADRFVQARRTAPVRSTRINIAAE
jgi:hypothetical protein